MEDMAYEVDRSLAVDDWLSTNYQSQVARLLQVSTGIGLDSVGIFNPFKGSSYYRSRDLIQTNSILPYFIIKYGYSYLRHLCLTDDNFRNGVHKFRRHCRIPCGRNEEHPSPTSSQYSCALKVLF